MKFILIDNVLSIDVKSDNTVADCEIDKLNDFILRNESKINLVCIDEIGTTRNIDKIYTLLDIYNMEIFN